MSILRTVSSPMLRGSLRIIIVVGSLASLANTAGSEALAVKEGANPLLERSDVLRSIDLDRPNVCVDVPFLVTRGPKGSDRNDDSGGDIVLEPKVLR